MVAGADRGEHGRWWQHAHFVQGRLPLQCRPVPPHWRCVQRRLDFWFWQPGYRSWLRRRRLWTLISISRLRTLMIGFGKAAFACVMKHRSNARVTQSWARRQWRRQGAFVMARTVAEACGSHVHSIVVARATTYIFDRGLPRDRRHLAAGPPARASSALVISFGEPAFACSRDEKCTRRRASGPVMQERAMEKARRVCDGTHSRRSVRQPCPLDSRRTRGQHQ